MNEIYIVTSGNYSDYGIRAVFTSKEDADRYALQRSTGDYGETHDVEVWPVGAPPAETLRYKVSAGKPDQLFLSVYDAREEYDDEPPPVEGIRFWDGLRWDKTRYTDPSIQVEFLIEARDPDHARKIGGEKVALAFSGQQVYPVIGSHSGNPILGYASIIPVDGGWNLHFVEQPAEVAAI